MRRTFLALLLIPAGALASDHNNIDSGRPLRFEDAYSIAYRERVFEFGLNWSESRSGAVLEFKQGFAMNQEWGIAVSPVFEGRTSAELTYLHGWRREIGDSPALAYRLNVGIDGEENLEGRVRLIATRALGQYDRIHLNLDVEGREGHRPEFGAILGYSVPIGFPRRFDQTLVAEFSWLREDDVWSGAVGLGLRQQMDPTTTFDIGLEVGRGTVVRLGFAKSF